MNPDILAGMTQASLPTSLIATSIGVLFGLIVGMIPGMTISTGIIVLLPLTFVLPADISIALLLGLYVGGMTGGSFSAVLLNIPGTPSASATAMDGFPMASRGEAGRALGVAITASFIGGLFSFLCLYLIAPLLAEVALEFRTQDMFSLLFFGMTIICSFAAKSLVKGLLSGAIGLLIVTIGQDPVMGTALYIWRRQYDGGHPFSDGDDRFVCHSAIGGKLNRIEKRQGRRAEAGETRINPADSG